MELLQTPTNYKGEDFPESPYLRARMDWDERIGSTSVQASNWRLACFGSIFLSLLLLIGNAFQLTQRKIVPMVISVQKEGEASVIGKAEGNYEPGEAQVRYFLLQFLRFVRTVPSDAVVVKNNWLQAYKFLTREAAQTLNTIVNSDIDSPLKKIGSDTVAIQPISVLFVQGSNSYQARWSETVFDKNGTVTDSYTMTGLFTIEVQAPTSEEAILVNPLGIFIKSFQWSRDLEKKR